MVDSKGQQRILCRILLYQFSKSGIQFTNQWFDVQFVSQRRPKRQRLVRNTFRLSIAWFWLLQVLIFWNVFITLLFRPEIEPFTIILFFAALETIPFVIEDYCVFDIVNYQMLLQLWVTQNSRICLFKTSITSYELDEGVLFISEPAYRLPLCTVLIYICCEPFLQKIDKPDSCSPFHDKVSYVRMHSHIGTMKRRLSPLSSFIDFILLQRSEIYTFNTFLTIDCYKRTYYFGVSSQDFWSNFWRQLLVTMFFNKGYYILVLSIHCNVFVLCSYQDHISSRLSSCQGSNIPKNIQIILLIF